MNNKKITAVVALSLIWATNVQAAGSVPPEVPTPVELSNHDINRIVCPGAMNDLIFSKEKGMIGHFSGNNAFIKFKVEDAGDEYIYADTASELFAVCNGAVYTLIVTPTDIPSVTLRLSSPMGNRLKKNIAHYKNLPLEKQVLQIIQEAYNQAYPSSYRVTNTKNLIALAPDVETTCIKNVDVDGVGLRLRQYQVKALSPRVELDEKLFLTPAVGSSILAVAVENHNLVLNATTRVFVVEKKERK